MRLSWGKFPLLRLCLLFVPSKHCEGIFLDFLSHVDELKKAIQRLVSTSLKPRLNHSSIYPSTTTASSSNPG
ncbi:hypothetical protein LEMLEM_LOCUS6972, partial [Lemmus lemmus]